MELRSLHYFATVAQELHYGRAAKRLHISQPPLSRQIKNLEREMGVSLFHRTKRQVQLTPAGESFLRDVNAILTALNEAVNAARRASRGEIGRLVIGFFLGTTYKVLPRILERFRAEHPNVKLVLQDLELHKVGEALENRDIDVGFLRPPAASRAIASEVLLREPFVLAVPEQSRFSRMREVRLADLADEPFIMFTPTHSVVYGQIMAGCHRAGFQPRVVQEARRPETLVGLVRAGAGIALVAESLELHGGPGVVYKKVVGPLPMTEIAMAWNSHDASPLLQSFLAIARSAMKKGPRSRSATARRPA